MNPEVITGFIVAFAIAVVGIWDLIAILRWGPTATVSQFWWDLAKKYPVINVLIGIVIGHLTFPIILSASPVFHASVCQP